MKESNVEYMEFRDVDKSTWPSGPWHDEPDRVQWKDEASGLACLAVRHPRSGHWCGYVGVTDEHPFFKMAYSGDGLQMTSVGRLQVHGGVTYTEKCDGARVCHVTHPDEEAWWIGFDCMHSGDRSPGMEQSLDYYDGSYKSLRFVKNECAQLAAQIKEAA